MGAAADRTVRYGYILHDILLERMHDLNAQLDFPKRKGPHDRTSHVVLNVLVGGSGLGARSLIYQHSINYHVSSRLSAGYVGV